MSDSEDLLGDDDLFGEIPDEKGGGDPEAVAPSRKKKKKDLDWSSLQKHGYEPPPPIEQSDTYKRIQTERIIRQQEEVQAEHESQQRAAVKAELESKKLTAAAAEKDERHAEQTRRVDAGDVKKRSTMKDKTKDKRARGQAGISGTANGYWKSEQEFHLTRDTFD
eukprot:TRINITY_DN12961_c0_g1_i2.p1 TRINITY_DN12961_c0_g1~~TRINITY_DN12961_c0_g1_i2.p1  ORF type:complete len:165 (+),score=56.14 TRINITY_DN12961_c0_g1_i2:161-655(+)